jgi:uncharacterized protein YndB with AHSA1/START domain
MIVQRSIEINAAPDKIWPHITEPELILKWFTFLTKYEFEKAGRGGEGVSFYWQEKQGGFVYLTLHYRITKWVENEIISFKLTSGPVKKDDQVWQLKKTQAGSKFAITTEIEFTGGFLDSLMKPAVTMVINRNIDKVLKNLKAAVEAG